MGEHMIMIDEGVYEIFFPDFDGVLGQVKKLDNGNWAYRAADYGTCNPTDDWEWSYRQYRTDAEAIDELWSAYEDDRIDEEDHYGL